MLNKGVIENLRGVFDLNQYEANIWVHLLSKGVSTAGELSDISNVPRSRAYDVLESLEKKGFVVIKIGKPIQYIAVPPAEVINRVQKRLKMDTESRINRLENLKESDLINEISELYEKGIKTFSPTELSGAFRGRQNIYDQMESMIRNAESSVKIVTTEEGIIRKLSALRNVLKKAHERGVTVEVKAPITEKNQKAIKELKEYVEFGDNNNCPARYCIVDERQALMLLLNDDKVHPSYDVGIWVNSESISKLLNTR